MFPWDSDSHFWRAAGARGQSGASKCALAAPVAVLPSLPSPCLPATSSAPASAASKPSEWRFHPICVAVILVLSRLFFAHQPC